MIGITGSRVHMYPRAIHESGTFRIYRLPKRGLSLGTLLARPWLTGVTTSNIHPVTDGIVRMERSMRVLTTEKCSLSSLVRPEASVSMIFRLKEQKL